MMIRPPTETASAGAPAGWVPRRALIVWVVLVLLTVANPLLGRGEPSGQHTFGIAILTIAVVKIRFVALDFMELRGAPAAMRIAFEAYCLILWTVLTAGFLWL